MINLIKKLYKKIIENKIIKKTKKRIIIKKVKRSKTVKARIRNVLQLLINKVKFKIKKYFVRATKKNPKPVKTEVKKSKEKKRKKVKKIILDPKKPKKKKRKKVITDVIIKEPNVRAPEDKINDIIIDIENQNKPVNFGSGWLDKHRYKLEGIMSVLFPDKRNSGKSSAWYGVFLEDTLNDQNWANFEPEFISHVKEKWGLKGWKAVDSYFKRIENKYGNWYHFYDYWEIRGENMFFLVHISKTLMNSPVFKEIQQHNLDKDELIPSLKDLEEGIE